MIDMREAILVPIDNPRDSPQDLSADSSHARQCPFLHPGRRRRPYFPQLVRDHAETRSLARVFPASDGVMGNTSASRGSRRRSLAERCVTPVTPAGIRAGRRFHQSLDRAPTGWSIHKYHFHNAPTKIGGHHAHVCSAEPCRFASWQPWPRHSERPACWHNEVSVLGKSAGTTASSPAMSMPNSSGRWRWPHRTAATSPRVESWPHRRRGAAQPWWKARRQASHRRRCGCDHCGRLDSNGRAKPADQGAGCCAHESPRGPATGGCPPRRHPGGRPESRARAGRLRQPV